MNFDELSRTKISEQISKNFDCDHYNIETPWLGASLQEWLCVNDRLYFIEKSLSGFLMENFDI